MTMTKEIRDELYDTLCYFRRAKVTRANGRLTVETCDCLMSTYPDDYETQEFNDVDVLAEEDYARKKKLLKYGLPFNAPIQSWMK